MKKLVALGSSAALIAGLLVSFPAFAASLAQNGSFENGSTDPGSYLTVNAGDSTTIANWSVDSGSVDWVGSYWQAQDGSRSVDLNGLAQGSLSQTFATTPGTQYKVTFELSGNPDTRPVGDPLWSPSLKDVQVSATGGSPQDFTFDTASMGNSFSNMKWQPESYTFTANSNSTTLTFASQIQGAFGPAIDNVDVEASAPVCTPTIDGTAAHVATAGETITGTIDATGCDIGVFIGSGINNVTVTATIHDANQEGIMADGASNTTITGSTVTNIGNHTGGVFDPNGVQNGQGIRFQGNSTGSITDNNVSAYEKNGIAVTHGSSATIDGNTVTGLGPVNFIAQNGIEIFAGATGSITNNTVSGNYCTVANVGDNCTLDPTSGNSASDGAAGILIYGPSASSVTVSGNTLTGNQFSIWTVATPALSITGNTVTGTNGSTDTGIAIASADQFTTGLGLTETSTTGSVDHNTISGVKYAALLQNFSGGSHAPAVTVNRNSLLASTDGLWTNAATIDGTCNWWGASSGPGPIGFGSGSGVTAGANYTPWLMSADLDGACNGMPFVITDPATNIAPFDATLNGTDGPLNAQEVSFWVSTSTFATTSPFIPAGVYSTPVLGPVNAGGNFSAQLASLTTNAVVHGQVPGTMPAVTAGTKYYFVAWGEINGTWYPGDELSFTTTSLADACDNPNSAPAGSGYTLVKGTTANETITLAPNTMFVSKGNGNNTIKGGDGNYIVCTGSGNDKITLGNGDDTVAAGGGNNTITLGDGMHNVTSGSGNDNITIGTGASSVDAGGGNNTVKTGDGDQTVTAGSGNDTITTGAGNDTINAGGGNNTVKSGGGNDTVTTGSGNDNINGGAGTDTCNAGSGNNVKVGCELP